MLSTVFDRNGIPVLFQLFTMGDLSRNHLEAVSAVFSRDEAEAGDGQEPDGEGRPRGLCRAVPGVQGGYARDWQAHPAPGAARAAKGDRGALAPAGPQAPPVRSAVLAGESGGCSSRGLPGPGTGGHPGHPGPQRKHRRAEILIVDDDEIIRNLLQIRLGMLGYSSCTLAESGGEAVELAGKMKPDFVFMDISMPGETDGIEAAREIKARVHSRIVFISGLNDPEILERAAEIGPPGFIIKPFTDTDLRVILELRK